MEKQWPDWTGHTPQPVTCEENDYCLSCGRRIRWIDNLGHNGRSLEERENRWSIEHEAEQHLVLG